MQDKNSFIQIDREEWSVCFDSLMVYLLMFKGFTTVLEGSSYSRDTEH